MSSPTASDDSVLAVLNARGGVRMLHTIAWLLTFNGVVEPLAFYLENGYFRIASGVLGGIVGVATLVLLRRGALYPAVQLLTWGAIIIPFVIAVRYGGLRDNSLILLPVTAMATGFLFGTRQAVIVSLVILAELGCLLLMHLSGHVFTEQGGFTQYLIANVISILLGAIFGAKSTEAFRAQFRQVRELSDNLELRVAERTQELSTALEELRRVQEDLITSEKLASLGAMVAGISHELNTPIGNARVTAGTLSEQMADFRQSLAQNPLRRSTLDEFLATSEDMAALIERSTERAADLISSFKQVAVDQTSEQRREFDLHSVVDDIVTTLRPGFKNTRWRLIVDIPDGISCNSFPGPLGQIIANLVQNAAIHGVGENGDGTIRISAHTTEKGRVVLSVEDDGAGMDSATLARIFDPFFTTRLGKGGSGLGLSISHRLATRVLGGSLTATAQPGMGSCFTLNFPCIAAGKV